jgi:hypothetical protein
MFTKLAKFRLVQSRYTAPRLGQAIMHCNDNLPGPGRPRARRRIASPALTCRWLVRNGRLECRWHADASGDAPIADVDEPARRAAARVFT